MNVTSSGIINGVIQPQYGGHGMQFNENGISTYSLSFTVEDAPQGRRRSGTVLFPQSWSILRIHQWCVRIIGKAWKI